MTDISNSKQWNAFLSGGAFKLLALSGLSGHALSLMCYLLNCYVSGIDDVMSSSRELSVLLGFPEPDVRQALELLIEMNMVSCVRDDGERQVYRVQLQTEHWRNLRIPALRDGTPRRRIGDAANIWPIRPLQPPDIPEGGAELQAADENSLDALSYPLERGSGASEPAGEGEETGRKTQLEDIVEAFMADHPEADRGKERVFAETLLAQHDGDLVLHMVQTFGRELSSLGLLIGAWLHFSQKFVALQSDEQMARLDDYRRQNEAQERNLRRSARRLLDKAASESPALVLSSHELTLLHVLSEHAHPRKQLYWALKMRHRYPELTQFLKEVETFAQTPQHLFRRS